MAKRKHKSGRQSCPCPRHEVVGGQRYISSHSCSQCYIYRSMENSRTARCTPGKIIHRYPLQMTQDGPQWRCLLATLKPSKNKKATLYHPPRSLVAAPNTLSGILLWIFHMLGRGNIVWGLFHSQGFKLGFLALSGLKMIWYDIWYDIIWYDMI
jgi:hypothetical protein